MPDPDPHPDPQPHPNPHDWTSLLGADLRALAVRRPWGRALMAIGWVHLGFFLVCQAVYTVGDRSPALALVLWASEVYCLFWVMRVVAGRDWIKESPTVGLVVRVWITFLILSFNVVTLNHLTGWSVDWFKPVWCTLASFGFATMAWLFGYRLLIPAFQMYFTGLLMVRFPSWNYLIHGASWCLALQYVGWDLIRQRARLIERGKADPIETSTDSWDRIAVEDRQPETAGDRR